MSKKNEAADARRDEALPLGREIQKFNVEHGHRMFCMMADAIRATEPITRAALEEIRASAPKPYPDFTNFKEG